MGEYTRLAPGSETTKRLDGQQRRLREAAERMLSDPQGKIALVLYLSHLHDPRPHHLRVAGVVLREAAQRYGGQVFTAANEDLVLLCNDALDGSATSPHAPMHLPSALSRLFAADASTAESLTSFWRLESDAAALRAYLATTIDIDQRQNDDEDTRAQLISLVALQEILAKAPLTGLLKQQVGMTLSPDRGRSLANRLSPAFQEIGLHLGNLKLQSLVYQIERDRFLERHLVATLDLRLVQLLHDDLSDRGSLTRAAVDKAVPVLLELGLQAIISPEFVKLSQLGKACGLKLMVAVSLLEAAIEINLLDYARGALKLAGHSLVITRVDPDCLGLINPQAFHSDLIVLSWSRRLRQASSAMRFLEDLRRRGAGQVVLRDVDNEGALVWGQTNGVGLFQGPYLDQIQAAIRMQNCHSASGCALRQCLLRAAAMEASGRAGCANPALLAARFGP